MRYDEIQVKLFLDYFIHKKILLFGEVVYSIGKNPWQYNYNTKIQTDKNPVYTPTKNYPIFVLGIAYRVRLDLEN